MEGISPEAIRGLSYVDLTAFLKETNRPPGGKHSVRLITQNAFLGPDKHVLEIGCNTGFTSIELAKTAGCKVVGVDVNKNAVQVAIQQAETAGCSDKTWFQLADACELPFGDAKFDAVVTGGANAWIQDRERALAEYWRVLKDWGFLCTVPFYYRSEPPDRLVEDLNRALGIRIQKWTRQFWCDLFEQAGYEPYFLQPDVPTTVVTKQALEDYARHMAGRLFGPDQPQQLQATVQKILSYWELFNENNQYLAFSVMIWRKRTTAPERTIFD